MMLDDITPVILTYNEEANIGRVLDRLYWAKRVIVVDSFSDDGTLEILSRYPRVKLYQRAFDEHAKQWNYAISETDINTGWVLALDSDYILTDAFLNELEYLKPNGLVGGYQVGFMYCIYGKPLRGTLYVPVTVLYRRNNVIYEQDGHTQRIAVKGEVYQLASKIFHDDRKPLARWFWAQNRYMSIETDMISRTPWSELTVADKLRKLIFFAPVVTFIYCLFIKGGLLDGWAGLYYAIQRTVAEMILSLKLVENKLKRHIK